MVGPKSGVMRCAASPPLIGPCWLASKGNALSVCSLEGYMRPSNPLVAGIRPASFQYDKVNGGADGI